jgi:hypothetical protein
MFKSLEKIASNEIRSTQRVAFPFLQKKRSVQKEIYLQISFCFLSDLLQHCISFRSARINEKQSYQRISFAEPPIIFFLVVVVVTQPLS